MDELTKLEGAQLEHVSTASTSDQDLSKVQQVDSLHDDEGAKVLTSYSGDASWTAEEEKALLRKIDIKLLPILFVTYMLQYYDKAMLSQAVWTTHQTFQPNTANILTGHLRPPR